MIPRRIMRPSIARDNEQWTRGAECIYHRSNQSIHTRPSPCSPWATAHLPSRWGWEAELAWAHSRLATSVRFKQRYDSDILQLDHLTCTGGFGKHCTISPQMIRVELSRQREFAA